MKRIVYTKYVLLIFLITYGLLSCRKKGDKEEPKPKPVPPVEEKLTITVEPFKSTIEENPTARQSLGKINAKTNKDDVTLTYTLQSPSQEGAINIDKVTGEVTVDNPKYFDFESKPTITAKCVVGGGDVTKIADIAISIEDVQGEPFVTKWEVKDNQKIYFYTNRLYPNDIHIDWGDGTKDQSLGHTYSTAGVYTVKVTGTYPILQCGKLFGTGARLNPALVAVIAWGDNEWKTMQGMFGNCNSLRDIEASDMPNLTEVTDMSYMFMGASSFDGDLSQWDISQVTNLKGMFNGARSFKGDLSQWDTKQVTDMSYMFYRATKFEGDISLWNTQAVTDMSRMFVGATRFNGDLSQWNTENVTDMAYMFKGATYFNGDIGQWNTSKVTNMSGMFEVALNFNKDLSQWDTQSVKTMSQMFRKAEAFRQNISNWNVDDVITFDDFAKEAGISCSKIPVKFKNTGCQP